MRLLVSSCVSILYKLVELHAQFTPKQKLWNDFSSSVPNLYLIYLHPLRLAQPPLTISGTFYRLPNVYSSLTTASTVEEFYGLHIIPPDF